MSGHWSTGQPREWRHSSVCTSFFLLMKDFDLISMTKIRPAKVRGQRVWVVECRQV